jgi:hypothetical protein
MIARPSLPPANDALAPLLQNGRWKLDSRGAILMICFPFLRHARANAEPEES